ncbi:hypothetical protein [Marinobacter sp. GH_1]|uniref:hypothetical protein n=1 Tax=Marinobacter sp. GH_1 TaxID=3402164 RepID=UPI003B433098
MFYPVLGGRIAMPEVIVKAKRNEALIRTRCNRQEAVPGDFRMPFPSLPLITAGEKNAIVASNNNSVPVAGHGLIEIGSFGGLILNASDRFKVERGFASCQQ